jgi:hypothetical protein
MNYFNPFVEKGKSCSSDMPQLYLLRYSSTRLMINLINVILINTQGISPKGIAD